MDKRADFITIATADLDLARSFYVDGLGWTPLLDVPGEIIFFQIGFGLTLGLFEATKFSEDAELGAEPATVSGVTLSHNVDSPADVDRVIGEAAAAGATVLKQPQYASFGGYHAHFADPNGTVWEVAHNPGWHVDEAGTVWLSE